MYNTELEQGVFIAVVELKALKEVAYINTIVCYLIVKHSLYNEELTSFKARVRKRLKKLSDYGYLEEREGDMNSKRVSKLYYTTGTKNYIMFGNGESEGGGSQFFSMFKHFLTMGGGAKFLGMGKNMVIENEASIVDFIVQRQREHVEKGLIPHEETSLNLSVGAIGGKLVIIEGFLVADEKGQLITKIIEKHSAAAFCDLIIETVKNGE